MARIACRECRGKTWEVYRGEGPIRLTCPDCGREVELR